MNTLAFFSGATGTLSVLAVRSVLRAVASGLRGSSQRRRIRKARRYADASGVVYLIGAEDGEGLVKIGTTTGPASRRLAALQTGSPVRLAVLWATPGGVRLESYLHLVFARQRRHGEWFDLGPSAVQHIKAALPAADTEVSS